MREQQKYTWFGKIPYILGYHKEEMHYQRAEISIAKLTPTKVSLQQALTQNLRSVSHYLNERYTTKTLGKT